MRQLKMRTIWLVMSAQSKILLLWWYMGASMVTHLQTMHKLILKQSLFFFKFNTKFPFFFWRTGGCRKRKKKSQKSLQRSQIKPQVFYSTHWQNLSLGLDQIHLSAKGGADRSLTFRGEKKVNWTHREEQNKKNQRSAGWNLLDRRCLSLLCFQIALCWWSH